MKNQPYVKVYNENGILLNPIIDRYKSIITITRIQKRQMFKRHSKMFTKQYIHNEPKRCYVGEYYTKKGKKLLQIASTTLEDLRKYTKNRYKIIQPKVIKIIFHKN